MATPYHADVLKERIARVERLGYSVRAFAIRSDGYTFMLVDHYVHGRRIFAGCRNFSVAEYRKHVGGYRRSLGFRRGLAKRAETLAIINALVATADASWRNR